MTKIFVLRINSLLSSEDSTLRFGSDNEVVIPLAVVDELQSYKGKPEKRRIADSILNYLDSLDVSSLFGEGVIQSNGSILKIERNYHDITVEMEGISATDRRVFQVCLGLINDNQDKKVILVSKEPGIRIKAKSLGIEAEDFKDDLFPAPLEQYKGRISLTTTSDAVNDFYANGYLPVSRILSYEEIDWIQNIFTEVKAVDGNQSFIGRFDGEKIVNLCFGTKASPYGISTQNAGQRMLLECLLTDWTKAPLVVVKGGAGTGKTYCSLAAALEGVEKDEYSRILVATPPETVGNEEIGYLPGDIDDKLSPRLGGIKDNLSIIINGEHVKKSSKNEPFESGDYYFERGIIQIQPIGFLRGRTIVNSLFIIDETQNIDPRVIKSIVTRAAKGSKFVFLGDPSQVDNPKLNERYNGLVYLSEKFKGNPLCWQITLYDSESVRGDLSTAALKIL